MSLAYLEGKDGKLQVAYEAMDKISVFKHKGAWIWYCPCCDRKRVFVLFDTCWNDKLYGLNKHIEGCHSDED